MVEHERFDARLAGTGQAGRARLVRDDDRNTRAEPLMLNSVYESLKIAATPGDKNTNARSLSVR